MNAVVDASVMVKWIFPDANREAHVDQAIELLSVVRARKVILQQPPHWLAEVAAVVTRLDPEAAETAIDLLDAMDLPVVTDPDVFKRASRIAHELSHHLFDTLYHALALERGSVLISADDRYFRKAQHLGRIVLLENWLKVLPAEEGTDLR